MCDIVIELERSLDLSYGVDNVDLFGKHDLVKYILNDNQYREDFLVRMVFHSASIEGNTITIEETQSLLIDDVIPNFNRRVSPREVYELSNLRNAWDVVLSNIGQRISVKFMHELHKFVMLNIDFSAGGFKKVQNMIGGKLTVSLESTPTEIQYLLHSLYLNDSEDQRTYYEQVMRAIEFHIRYEEIHPYEDGNGRTGRLLMNQVLLERGIPPFVIKSEDKAFYYKCLKERDAKSLTDYAISCIEEERVLINRNGELV